MWSFVNKIIIRVNALDTDNIIHINFESHRILFQSKFNLLRGSISTHLKLPMIYL